MTIPTDVPDVTFRKLCEFVEDLTTGCGLTVEDWEVKLRPFFREMIRPRIPVKVKIKVPVRSEFPGVAGQSVKLEPGKIVDVVVNPQGAVSARTDFGLLGLKPGEFEVVEAVPGGPPAQGLEELRRGLVDASRLVAEVPAEADVTKAVSRILARLRDIGKAAGVTVQPMLPIPEPEPDPGGGMQLLFDVLERLRRGERGLDVAGDDSSSSWLGGMAEDLERGISQLVQAGNKMAAAHRLSEVIELGFPDGELAEIPEGWAPIFLAVDPTSGAFNLLSGSAEAVETMIARELRDAVTNTLAGVRERTRHPAAVSGPSKLEPYWVAEAYTRPGFYAEDKAGARDGTVELRKARAFNAKHEVDEWLIANEVSELWKPKRINPAKGA